MSVAAAAPAAPAVDAAIKNSGVRGRRALQGTRTRGLEVSGSRLLGFRLHCLAPNCGACHCRSSVSANWLAIYKESVGKAEVPRGEWIEGYPAL